MMMHSHVAEDAAAHSSYNLDEYAADERIQGTDTLNHNPNLTNMDFRNKGKALFDCAKISLAQGIQSVKQYYNPNSQLRPESAPKTNRELESLDFEEAKSLSDSDLGFELVDDNLEDIPADETLLVKANEFKEDENRELRVQDLPKISGPWQTRYETARAGAQVGSDLALDLAHEMPVIRIALEMDKNDWLRLGKNAYGVSREVLQRGQPLITSGIRRITRPVQGRIGPPVDSPLSNEQPKQRRRVPSPGSSHVAMISHQVDELPRMTEEKRQQSQMVCDSLERRINASFLDQEFRYGAKYSYLVQVNPLEFSSDSESEAQYHEAMRVFAAKQLKSAKYDTQKHGNLELEQEEMMRKFVKSGLGKAHGMKAALPTTPIKKRRNRRHVASAAPLPESNAEGNEAEFDDIDLADDEDYDSPSNGEVMVVPDFIDNKQRVRKYRSPSFQNPLPMAGRRSSHGRPQGKIMRMYSDGTDKPRRHPVDIAKSASRDSPNNKPPQIFRKGSYQKAVASRRSSYTEPAVDPKEAASPIRPSPYRRRFSSHSYTSTTRDDSDSKHELLTVNGKNPKASVTIAETEE